MITKKKPFAIIKESYGTDGWDCRSYIQYHCCGCGKIIKEDVVACDKCVTFFDWSEKAHIVIHKDIEWR